MQSEAGIMSAARARVALPRVLPASSSFPIAVCLLRVGRRAVASEMANTP